MLIIVGRKVHDHMTELIDQYFIKHLELSREDAYKLHQEYYKTYGLAIEGLVRHHKIDPLEYNKQVDDALPLESIIFPDPALRKLLQDIDKSKVKLWLFTNAYVTHGRRVVRLLGVEDIFEGMTFCDYAQDTMTCKPHPEMFAKAMNEANVKKAKDCYFVGKSWLLEERLGAYTSRRFRLELQEGGGTGVDNCSSRRRRRTLTGCEGLQVSDQTFGRTQEPFPAVFQGTIDRI
jgi:pyrimidine 5'-nucleotidase